MAKLLPEEVSLVDVAEISADPRLRTSTTPFGARPGERIRYVGRAVAWKSNPQAMPNEVREGLEKAIEISRKCEGVKGVGIDPTTGKVVPNKVICQIKKAGKIEGKKAKAKKKGGEYEEE